MVFIVKKENEGTPEEKTVFYYEYEDENQQKQTQEVKLGITTPEQMENYGDTPRTQKASIEIANNYGGSHKKQVVVNEETIDIPELDNKGDLIPEQGKSLAETEQLFVTEKGVSEEKKKENKENLVLDYTPRFINFINTIGDGETFQFTNGGGKATWSVIDANGICDIDGNGLFKALDPGKVTVIATIGSHSISCDVNITKFHNGNNSGTGWGDAAEIANGEQWENMLFYYSKSSYGPYPTFTQAYGYYKLVDDIDCTNSSIPENCYIWFLYIDGNNHSISNISSSGSIFSQSFETCWYSGDLYINNLTIKDSSFVAGFASYAYYVYLDGVNFENCICDNCVAQAIYSGTDFEYTNSYIKDCRIYGCAIAYNDDTGSNSVLENIFVENVGAMAGSYFQMCYGNIDFVNCSAKNINVSGGNQTAVGGFVGQVHGGKVSFDGCSVSGTIVSTNNDVSGFACSHAGGIITIKDCSVKKGTAIRNQGGGQVIAFAKTPSSITGKNTFDGVLYSSNISQAVSNGIFDVVEKINWKKYTKITDWSTIFAIENGNIKYIGVEHYDAVLVKQTISVDQWNNDKQIYTRSYEWQIGDNIVANDVNKNDNIGALNIITNYVNIVDSDNLSKIHYSSSNTDILSELDWVNTKYGFGYKGNVLYLNAQRYASGYYYLFAGTDLETSPTSVSVNVTFMMYDNEALTDSVTYTYTFTPTEIN